MANYRKSFNLRNGVQVDDDNFVVNANGLVGIGTSIPSGYLLNVYGDTRVTGLVTTKNLEVSGVATVGFLTTKQGAYISGVITATSFSGSASGLTGIYAIAVDGWRVSSGTISTTSNVGIGTTNPQGILQIGTGITFNSSGGALYAGIITASGFSGVLTATDLAGTILNDRLPSNINVGIVTATTGFFGNLTGVAATASSITNTANILVNSINSGFSTTGVSTVFTTSHVGTGGTAFSALNSGRIGVGTASPTSEIQVRKSNGTLIEVISDTSQARISVGQSVGVGKSTAVLRFGYDSKTFDIINNDTGNINSYLHAGPSGVGTGRFDWYYGQNISSPLMSLTHTGGLGIGITNPSNTIHVSGTSTVTGNAWFGNDLYVNNDIYFKTLRDGVVATNTNVTSGISTFSTIHLFGGSNVLGIGTNVTGSYKFKIQDNNDAYLGNKSVLGIQSTTETTFFASNLVADASLLKVFGAFYARNAYIGTSISASAGVVTATNGFSSGIGSAVQITTVGNRVYFTVPGVGSTSLQLF